MVAVTLFSIATNWKGQDNMNVTELLITGYDGSKPIFAVNLAPGSATVVLTSTDQNGDAVVDSTWTTASQAFTDFRGLVEDLAVVPAQ